VKYRKRPIIIEAEQWFPGKEIAGVIPISDGAVSHETVDGSSWPAYATIKTLEGYMTVSPGDWVITGVKGERYPCKPDIFEATYEPVADMPWEKEDAPYG
jgi:hypothetical protein